MIYKRLANCESEDVLNELQEELVDRFGLIPEPAQTLVDSHRLRLLGKPLDLIKIDASSSAITVQFGPDTTIEPQKIIALIQKKKQYRLAGQDKLRIDRPIADVKLRVVEIKQILRELAA